MKKHRILAIVFLAAAVVLSNVMCASVAFAYCNMLWGIRHLAYSAPASVAFLLAIPYGAVILLCLVLAWVFWRKARQ